MSYSSRLAFAIVLIGLMVLGGCRTYGGYGTEAKTYEAMQRSVDSFTNELNRAQAELRTLKDVAEKADTLQSFVNEFRALVDEHESLLHAQRQRFQRLTSDSGYRTLHHAYGATVTEQRMMQQKYQRVTQAVQAIVQGGGGRGVELETGRRYTIRPVGFPTSPSERSLTLNQALQGLQ